MLETVFCVPEQNHYPGSKVRVLKMTNQATMHRYSSERAEMKKHFGDTSFTAFAKMIIEKGKRVWQRITIRIVDICI